MAPAAEAASFASWRTSAYTRAINKVKLLAFREESPACNLYQVVLVCAIEPLPIRTNASPLGTCEFAPEIARTSCASGVPVHLPSPACSEETDTNALFREARKAPGYHQGIELQVDSLLQHIKHYSRSATINLSAACPNNLGPTGRGFKADGSYGTA